MKEEKEREQEKVEEKPKQQNTKCMYCPYCMNQICPMSGDVDAEYQVNEMYPTLSAGMQYQMNEMYPIKPNMPNWLHQNPYEYKYNAWAQNQYPYMQENMMMEQYKNPNTQRMINNTSYGCCCNPYGLGRY